MKRFLIISAVLSMIFTCACGDERTETEGSPDTEQEVQEEIVLPTEPEETEGGEYIPDGDFEESIPKPTLEVRGAYFEDGTSVKAFEIGESVAVTAEDRENGAFLYWQNGNGEIISGDRDLTLTVDYDCVAEAIFAEAEGELEFNTEDGKTYYVAGIGSVSGDTLIIPSTYNGKPVGRIAMTAFKDNLSIRRVYISEGITEIGKDAFAGCTSIEYLKIPTTIEKITDNEFIDCQSLEVVDIGIDMSPNLGVRYAKTAFVAEGVETLAFREFARLQRVFLPDGIEKIGEDAFRDCTSLEVINLPDSVTEIGDNAFRGCHKLYGVTFPKSLKKIGEYAFFQCNGLSYLSLPDLTTLGKGAFEACRGIHTVTLPDTLSVVPEYAFTGCKNLTCVTLGKNTEGIDKYAFKECTALKSVALPETLKYIGIGAFEKCEALEDIYLPNAITEIRGGAFEDCTALKSITLPERITSLKDDTFRGCTALREITASANLTSAEMSAFNGVARMDATVYYNGTQSEWEEHFAGASAFEEMIMKFQANTHYDFDTGFRYTSNGDGTCRIGKIKTSDIVAEELVIPEKSPKGDTITHIDRGTFDRNNTIKSVVIEAPLRVIPAYAFDGCGELEKVTLPETVEIIDDGAFRSCQKLQEINLPDSVRIIGDNAFDFCRALEKVTLPASLEKVGYGAFTFAGLREVSFGEKVRLVEDYAFSNCDSLERVEINSVGTVFDDCITSNMKETELHCNTGLEGWLSLDIRGGIISDKTTLYINGEKLVDVIVPRGVREIKARAFAGINTLGRVVFPDTVERIDPEAFYSCKAIDTLVLPSSMSTLEFRAFAFSGKIKSVVIPKSFTEISAFAFEGTDVENAFYEGTKEEWQAIINKNNNQKLAPVVSFYSEGKPAEDGSFWHYVDGEIVKW